MEQTKITKIIPLVLSAAAITLIFLWAVNFFNISYPISVTNKTISSELSVVGEGKVDVVPDTAEVSVGITVNAATVQAVETQMNQINNKIIQDVAAAGIDKNDIKTTQYSINPNYNYETGGNTISGYSGSATLSIKVKKTDLLGSVITAATSAGANQIYNTQYTIDDPNKYREQAREKAIQNAKEQGQKLAGELGIKLGKIVNISESSSGGGPIAYYKTDQAMGGALENPAPDLAPGTQTVSSVVTLYFERK